MGRIVFIMFFFAVSHTAIATPYYSIKDSTAKISPADTFHFQMTKKPMLALGLSAILPGAGQIYTGEWYLAPVFLGAIGGCLYGAILQNERYHYTKDSVKHQLDRGDTYNAGRYTAVMEFYRDDRDKWYIYAALSYIANILEAYISAHLYDFDVSDPGPRPYLSAPLKSEEPWRLGVQFRF